MQVVNVEQRLSEDIFILSISREIQEGRSGFREEEAEVETEFNKKRMVDKKDNKII